MKIFAFTLHSSDYLGAIPCKHALQSVYYCSPSNTVLLMTHLYEEYDMEFWQPGSSGVFWKPRRKQNIAPSGRSLSVTGSLAHADSTYWNRLPLLYPVSPTVLAGVYFLHHNNHILYSKSKTFLAFYWGFKYFVKLLCSSSANQACQNTSVHIALTC